MTRFAAVAVIACVASWSSIAGAECFARRPGDPPQCPQYYPTLTQPAPEPQSLDERTHVGIAPTGSTLAQGEVQYQLHELVWNRLSYGLTDRFEIAADFAYLIAGVGVRLQLTPPDSRFKLTVGGGLFGGWELSGRQGSVTAGYHGDTLSFYMSGSAFLDQDDDPLHMFLGQAGIAKQLTDRSVIAAYAGRFVTSQRSGHDLIHGLGGGYKYLGDRWDLDVGAIVPVEDGDEEQVVMPMVSFTYRN